jgi:hypothetical protein
MIIGMQQMKENLRISKELVQYLEKIITLQTSDLKLKDYDRGVKNGQLEIVQKIKVLYEAQERK